MKKLWKNSSLIWKVSSFLILLSCSPPKQSKQIDLNDQFPDEQADSVHIVSTTGNIVDYEMTAKSMYKFYDKKLTLADSVFITFFYEDDSIKSTFYSDKAEMNEIENTLIGIGNNVITSENGVMKAPRVILDRNTNQLFASDGVTLIRNNNVLKGEQMKSDLNLDRAKIIKVSAEGEPIDEDFDF